MKTKETTSTVKSRKWKNNTILNNACPLMYKILTVRK